MDQLRRGGAVKHSTARGPPSAPVGAGSISTTDVPAAMETTHGNERRNRQLRTTIDHITSIHCVSEKFTRVACYNSDIREPIWVIFGSNITASKQRKDTGGTGNREIASFHLNAACSFTNKHKNA